jgi:FkbM family methyltransferase
MFAYHLYRFFPLGLKNSVERISLSILRPRLKNHFSQFISGGDLVFDVGAYVGNYTEIFLELGARVVCVEPQPYCATKLYRKFGKDPRVRIVQKGLSDKPGTLPLSISTKSRTNSTFSKYWRSHPRYKDRAWDKCVKVPVTTLDDLIHEYGNPAFCKVDVEGYEPKVLKGLRSLIPILSFEFDQAFIDHVRLCVTHLTSLGRVRFNYALYGGSALDSTGWLNSNQLMTRLQEKSNGHLRGDIYVKYQLC